MKGLVVDMVAAYLPNGPALGPRLDPFHPLSDDSIENDSYAYITESSDTSDASVDLQ
jgi:hypothetical protein